MTTHVSKVRHGDPRQLVPADGSWHRIEAGGLEWLQLPRFARRVRLEYQLAGPIRRGELPAVLTAQWIRDTDPDDGDGPTGGTDHPFVADPAALPGYDGWRVTNAHVISDTRALQRVALRVRALAPRPGVVLELEVRVLKVDRL